MKEFNILLVADFLSEKEVSTALHAFSDLFHSVTFKHQRRLKLIIVESEENFPALMKAIKANKLTSSCHLISPINQSKVKEVLSESTVMFLPTYSNISKLIPIALENGLPIITLSTEITTEKLDFTCSQVIKVTYNSEIASKFSETFRMLYFDPEAQEILRKGSLTKFNEEYNWGREKIKIGA